MTAFARTVDRLFAHRDLARDAQYRAGGVAPGVGVRVITRQPDELVDYGDARIVRATSIVEVRITEVASPVAGDVFAIGAEILTVQGAPKRDAERLVWLCPCR